MNWFNRLILPFIIAIVTLCAANIQWGGNNWKDIIEADGKGYYAYLPAVFIYQDFLYLYCFGQPFIQNTRQKYFG